jgi:hypothetical protein
MLTFASHFLLAAGLLAASPHADNVVWNELLERGIPLAPGQFEKLPAPTMPDGLSPAEQQKKLTEVAGQAYPLPRLLRQSVVSPYILQQRVIEDQAGRGRVVSAWFIVYGDLARLEDTALLDRVLNTEEDSDVKNDGSRLDAKQLAARDIPWTEERANTEIFAHGTFALWKRVEVDATLRTYWTRSDESVIAAAVIDPRFTDDADFPNRWKPLQDRPGGATAGTPHPYAALGMYLKVTRLAEPEGALFVEWHLVFEEPQAWFDGANLIGSKMPAIVQSRVRAMRREMSLPPAK